MLHATLAALTTINATCMGIFVTERRCVQAHFYGRKIVWQAALHASMNDRFRVERSNMAACCTVW